MDPQTPPMTFAEFEARAHAIFREIPPQYREGVDGLEVERRAVPHPTLPEIFTLGECVSESYPTEFGGAGEVRSLVVLYYGSFLELSRTSDDWDWEEELFETITHEVRHHLESLASEDELEVLDYVEDQNFARREGESFDPFFYRLGQPLGPGEFVVDGDVFVEHSLDARAFESASELRVPWRGGTLRVPRPERLGDVHFVRLTGPELAEEGELYLVLVRRRGVGEWVRGLFSSAPLDVLQSEAAAAAER